MTGLVKLLGLIGGFCFAYCGVPLAVATVRAGRSLGTPVATAWGIVAGAVFMYAYLLLTYGFDWLLAVNYTVEIISWLIVVVYHYRNSKILLDRILVLWDTHRVEPSKT